MSKYDWSNVPYAFKWLAVDSNGKVMGYTQQPKLNPWGFAITSGCAQCINGVVFIGNWQDSLEERPK